MNLLDQHELLFRDDERHLEDLSRVADQWIGRHNRVMTTTTVRSTFIPKKGDGVYVHDIRGRELIDFTSFVGVCNLGYGKSVRPVFDAMIEHFEETGFGHTMAHDWVSIWATPLAERLAKLTPGNHEKKVFGATSGAGANEAAIKILQSARPHRTRYLVFPGAFHGRYGYTLPLLGGNEVRVRDFPMAFPVTRIPFPRPNGSLDSPEKYIQYVEKIIFPIRKEINALFIEMIQGEGGVHPAVDTYLYPLVDLCRENDIKIVADEVQTGVGRTGKLFACEYFPGFVPDVVTVAKGICAGIHILGAAIFDAALDFEELGRHSNTFGWNSFACVAAQKTLDLTLDRLGAIAAMSHHSSIEHLRVRLSHTLHEGINRTYKQVQLDHLRGEGWMLGFDVLDRHHNPYPRMRDAIVTCAESQKEGVLLIASGPSAIRMMPPITMTNDEADEALRRFENLPVWETI